jgi:hydrogenase maturation protease
LSEAKNGARILVIGVGNDLRGDDGAGLAVVRHLRERDVEGIATVEAPGGGASLIDGWNGADAVILIDCVRSGSAPGTIHRLSPPALTQDAAIFRHSTHAFSVPDAIELAGTMGRLPKRLMVVGIEGKSFQAGPGLSSEVRAALRSAVDVVMREARAMTAPSRVWTRHA